ncbi:MAG: folate-binding protein YgfZ [Rickettsiales bacterium]|nr:folate-binding protein YgfZ [Rickettsiales bacterium]
MSNILKDRAIIEVAGDDRKKFLQGLITNDINKASEENLIYSAMLNSQGRFLYDFFIFEIGEKLIVDCFASRRDEIIQKLNFYKLRAKVEIKKNDELAIVQNFSAGQFSDPRHLELGFRTYCLDKPETSENSYHAKRIALKIAESEHDLTYEKSFILEFGFDDLNAIDYQKGCYVGQELTARTHHTGQIRKKLFCVKIDSEIAPEKNSEITCQAKPVGLILSSSFINLELHALALIKISDDQNFNDFSQKLELGSHKIFIVS